jgi:hypothetical protein
MKKLVLAFSTLALAVASAGSSYHVKLFEKSVVGGTELKPGEYKIEVKDNRAIVKDGKNTAEADVKVENGDRKYPTTTVRYQNGDGKYRVTEILLGGTTTKLVFNNTDSADRMSSR